MACQPQSLIRDMDSQCPRKNRLSKTEEPTKESKDFDKNKSYHQSTVNLWGQSTKQLLDQSSANFSGQSQRSKRGHSSPYQQGGSNWYFGRENRSNNTLATGINTVISKNKQTDFGKVIYYNRNNKSHYANACLYLSKGKN